MANACLFIGWDRPRAGHDNDAYRTLMQDTIKRLDKFRSEGFYESYDVIGLTPHCGTLNAFVVLKGERAKLDELRRSDAFERLSMELAQLFDGYGVVPGVTLEGMQKVAERNPDIFK